MASYAQGTTVPVMRTVAELNTLLAKHGATGFAYGHEGDRHRVMFRIADRMCRFEIREPDWHDYRHTATSYRLRSEAVARRMAEDELKRRWRALLLVVKALLVGVADGVLSLSDAFLAYTLLPGGGTFGEWAEPQLDVIAATGQLPAVLPGGQPLPALPELEG